MIDRRSTVLGGIAASSVALAVLVLLAVGASAPRPVSEGGIVIRTWPLVLLGVGAVASVFVVVPAMAGVRILREADEVGRVSPWRRLVFFAALGVLLTVFRPSPDGLVGSGGGKILGLRPGAAPSADIDPVDATFTASPSVLVVAVVVALVVAVAVAVAVSRSRAVGGSVVDDPEVARVAERASDAALAAEDPRRAVLLAFAVLEESFADRGAPRRLSETQVQWVRRLLVERGAAPGPAARLAERFERARFSTAAITGADREGAIDDLAALVAPEHPAEVGP